MSTRPKTHTPADRVRTPPRALDDDRWVSLLSHNRVHWLAVPGLLVLTAVLAFTSLVGDSSTFDETSHLTVGYTIWRTGDFRYTPDHPPLGKLWAALPLLFMQVQEPDWTSPAWVKPDSFQLGREWLFQHNDGQRLLVAGRCMMVLLLLGTCLGVYVVSRRLWGPVGGLLALVIGALSPTLLAHGRLVTTDIPITCLTVWVLLAYARLAERITWGRLAIAYILLALASVAKMSWPLLLPALGAIALVVTLRTPPLEVALRGSHRGGASVTRLARRRGRLLTLASVAVGAGMCVWLGIWTCFGWRYSMLKPLPANATPEKQTHHEQTRTILLQDLARTLYNDDGTPQVGLYPAALRFAVAHELLPEAYLLGLGQMRMFTARRWAYLMGEYSPEGFRSYFPIAFALKTPIATQLLLLAGLAAVALRRTRFRDGPLLAGLLVFVALFVGNVVASRYNIGHRHLLPVYPLLYVLAGGAAAWLTTKLGRVLVAGAALWLLAANLWIHPHYLSYFNELIGGPDRAYKYLVDSNLDWGQDLRRLAAYARKFPDEPVKLAYFGSAPPTSYLPCTALPSHHRFTPQAELGGGLYAISATQYVAVYAHQARDEFWAQPDVRQAYAAACQALANPPPENAPPDVRAQFARARQAYQELAPQRLLWRLRHRSPDARVGYSLFAWHLNDADVRALLQP